MRETVCSFSFSNSDAYSIYLLAMPNEHLTRRQSLPYSFFAVLGANETSIRVTILNNVRRPEIDSITSRAVASRKTVFLSDNVLLGIPNSSAFQVQFEANGSSRNGILTRCEAFTNAFELFEDATSLQAYVQDEMNLPLGATIEDNLRLWELQDPPFSAVGSEPFSMKPPATSLIPSIKPSAVDISPQSEANPLSFLLSRYYNTLYSLTTPLTYFPKTALSRFRNLCDNDHATMQTHLLSVYLTTEQLEQRHTDRYGLDKIIDGGPIVPVTLTGKYELENQELFASKHFAMKPNEDALGKLILELKIREAQLQMLVLMELLVSWEIDEVAFMKNNLEKQEKEHSRKRKLTLIRRKPKQGKQQKKIIPTFLGTGIQDQDHPADLGPSVPRKVDEYTLYTSLITLVDQMSIWDTLLGRIKGEKDDNMFGFLAYVLVPFFNKQLPGTVKFVITKVKELRPKLHISRSKSKLKKFEVDAEIADEPLDEKPSDKPKRSSKFAKTLLSPEQRPFLRRANTSIGSSELQPAFLLKRSKSNLGSKNLKRRQVDISVAKPETQEPEEAKKTKLFLFGDARRVKSSSLLQVEATPAKATREPNISLVLATPLSSRTQNHHHIITETPQQDNGFRKPSIQERIALLAPPIIESSITSSPVLQSMNTPRLFLSVPGNPIIRSSPLEGVTSSPVSQHTQQLGMPLPLLDSPFFTTNDGSPPPKTSISRGSIFKRARVLEGRKTANRGVKKASSTDMKAPKAKAREVVVTTPLAPTDTRDPNSKEVDLGHTFDLLNVVTNTSSVPDSPPETKTIFSEPLSRVFGDTDLDSNSDSDYEKLLANIAKPTVRKYTKKTR